MNLIPTFSPPSLDLASRNTSEHKRIDDLLKVHRNKSHNSQPFFAEHNSSLAEAPRLSVIHRVSQRQAPVQHTVVPQQSSSIALFDGELSFDSTQLRPLRPTPVSIECNDSNIPTSKSLLPETDLSFRSDREKVARMQETAAKSIPTKTKQLNSFQALMNRVDTTTVAPPVAKKARRDPPSSGKTEGSISNRDPPSSGAMGRASKAIAPMADIAFQPEDFLGIERVCRNAAGSTVGLKAFLNHATSVPVITVTFLYSDLTTNHASTTTKYCTPSSPCHVWHCPCDKHIRSQFLTSKLLAAVVLVPPSSSFSSSSESSVTYFLPLIACIEPVSDSQDSTWDFLMEGRQALPIKCQTTLQQRVLGLLTVLTSDVTKVMYHVQVASMSTHRMCRVAGAQPVNLVDPRLGKYLLNPDIPDADLELSALVEEVALANRDVAGLGRLARCVQQCSAELNFLATLYTGIKADMEFAGLWTLFHALEMPVATILAGMEADGILVDVTAVRANEARLEQQLRKVDSAAHGAVGQTFNLSSPEQVSKLLYDTLHLNSDQMTALESIEASHGSGSTGRKRHASTSEEELQRIAHAHPVVPLILHHRALSKLLSTYIYGIKPLLAPDPAHASMASIHAIWNQTSVRTGRLSCAQPNLQNIPNLQSIDGETYDIRSIFLPRPGFLLVGADYSQIEMRVLAHLCQDPSLCDLFRQEGDIYSLLAGKIFNKELGEVAASERDKAKVICLGVLYGMGASATAAKLSIELSAAHAIINAFFNHFSQVKLWSQRIKSQAHKYRQVKTLLGRIRHLPLIASEDQAKAATAERQAVNSIIQGTASDLIKLAMVLSSREVNAVAPSARLLMQIHDELIFEVPQGDIDAFATQLRKVMEQEVVEALRFSVPLIANISVGAKWGTMAPWPPTPSSPSII